MRRREGKLSHTRRVGTLLAAVLLLAGCAATTPPAAPVPVAKPPAERNVPHRAYAAFCRGLSYCIEGKWERGLAYLSAAIDADPEGVYVYPYFLGACERLGKRKEAVERLRVWCARKPNSFAVNWMAAASFDRWGMEDDALAALERARSCPVSPRYRDDLHACLRRLAQLYLNRGELANAVGCYEEIRARKFAPDPVVDLRIAEAYQDAKQFAKAAQYFERVRAAKPKFAPALRSLALCYQATRQFGPAIDAAKACLALRDPAESWDTRALLADLYEEAGLDQEAARVRREVREILARRADAGKASFVEHLQLSLLLRKERRYNEALSVLERAKPMLDGADLPDVAATYHLALAETYYDKQDEAAAERELKKAVKLAPNRADASNFLGYFYAERGQKLDEAERLVKRALNREPDNGAYLDSLGWVYYQQAAANHNAALLHKALEVLLDAAKRMDDPVILDHIGDVYYALGQWDAAEQQWARSLKLWAAKPGGRPGPESVAKKLADLRRMRQQEGARK